MSPKTELTAGPGVQIIELTMDNAEDQDELNRRLRKPGEADSKKGKTLNAKRKRGRGPFLVRCKSVMVYSNVDDAERSVPLDQGRISRHRGP